MRLLKFEKSNLKPKSQQRPRQWKHVTCQKLTCNFFLSHMDIHPIVLSESDQSHASLQSNHWIFKLQNFFFFFNSLIVLGQGHQNPFSIFHCVSVFFRKEKTKTGKNFGNRSASVSVSTLAFCFGLCVFGSICVSDFHRSLSVSVKEKKKIMVWESQGSRGRAEQG